MGWVKGAQEWTLGGETPSAGKDIHAAHDHAAMMQAMPSQAAATSAVGIDTMVAKARLEKLAFPVIVTPPGAPGRFGSLPAAGWTIRSDAANRPQQASIIYDMTTGREVSREAFADGHVIDRVVGYGIAWHEGQLFGWVNQLIGVLTAIGLIVMAVSGFILWRRRKPEDALGAPPPGEVPARIGGVLAILLVLAALLPLLAASLTALWLFERLVLPHLPRLAQWLGAS